MNWVFIVFAYLSLFALGLADNVRGPIFPDLLQTFRLNDTSGSLFFLLPSLCAVINNLCSRYWLPTLGPVRALFVYQLAMVFGLFVMGSAGTYIQALVGVAALGLGMGGIGIAQNVLVSWGAPISVRRRALSGLHAMYGLSSLLAPLLVGWRMAQGRPWQEIFIILSVMTMILSVVSFLVMRSQRRGRLDSPREGSTKFLHGKNAVSAARLWVPAMMTLNVVAEIMISSRLVLYARREAGLSIDEANGALSLFFLLLFIGRLLGAILHWPIGNRKLLALSNGLSFAFFLGGLLIHPVGLALCGLSMSVFYPVTIAMISEEFAENADQITADAITFPSFGLMLMHPLIGLLSDNIGLQKALFLGPFCLIIVALLLVRFKGKAEVRIAF